MIHFSYTHTPTDTDAHTTFVLFCVSSRHTHTPPAAERSNIIIISSRAGSNCWLVFHWQYIQVQRSAALSWPGFQRSVFRCIFSFRPTAAAAAADCLQGENPIKTGPTRTRQGLFCFLHTHTHTLFVSLSAACRGSPWQGPDFPSKPLL